MVTQEPCGSIRDRAVLGSSTQAQTRQLPWLTPSPQTGCIPHPPLPALLSPRLWALQEGFPVLGSRTLTSKETEALLAAH